MIDCVHRRSISFRTRWNRRLLPTEPLDLNWWIFHSLFGCVCSYKTKLSTVFAELCSQSSTVIWSLQSIQRLSLFIDLSTELSTGLSTKLFKSNQSDQLSFQVIVGQFIPAKMDQDSVAILLPNEHFNQRSIRETRNCKPVVILAIQTVLLVSCSVLLMSWQSLILFKSWSGSLLQVIYTIFTLVFDYIVDIQSDSVLLKASRSSTVIYFSHLAIRLLCLCFKIYLDRYYHRELRLYGYAKHFDNTTFLSELTHILFNKITLLLLLNASVYQMISSENDDVIHLFGTSITQTQVAKIIAVVISCIITVVSGKKLQVEIDFQRKGHAPDTLTENDLNDTRQSSNDIGLRSANLTDELLEKQHELIVNLKMQNAHLRELLMKANETQDSNDPQPQTSWFRWIGGLCCRMTTSKQCRW